MAADATPSAESRGLARLRAALLWGGAALLVASVLALVLLLTGTWRLSTDADSSGTSEGSDINSMGPTRTRDAVEAVDGTATQLSALADEVEDVAPDLAEYLRSLSGDLQASAAVLEADATQSAAPPASASAPPEPVAVTVAIVGAASGAVAATAGVVSAVAAARRKTSGTVSVM